MKERAQLEAMKRELQAAGYKVTIDARALDVGFQDLDLDLDLLAEWPEDVPRAPDRPRKLIVEVANRTRPGEKDGDLGRFERRILDDAEAVQRFEKITRAIEAFDEREVDFEIRFFDVSADQHAARVLGAREVRTIGGLAELLRTLNEHLTRAETLPADVRALVVAQAWTRLLRVIAHLHPGTGRRELPDADLRTIQKDLYDHKAMSLKPATYRRLHIDVLAIAEGGAGKAERLLELAPHVQELVAWAVRTYDIELHQARSARAELIEALRALSERTPRTAAAQRTGLAQISQLRQAYAFTDWIEALAEMLQSPDRPLPEDVAQEVVKRVIEP